MSAEVPGASDTATAPEAPPLPLLARPKNPSVLLIESTDGLAEAVATLAGATGPFSLDAERASGFKYSARAYLVQVQRGNSPIYLIDPVGVSESSEPAAFVELAKVLASDLWILHAATQDLACLAELGLRPSALFDTELGGRLAGFSRVGLGAMAEQIMGLRLAKEHSAVDWSQRPMHDDWLNYAALDVDVLPELMAGVEKALVDAKKLEFARQEFENLLTFAPKPPKPDRWRGMTGLHEVKDQQRLAVARSLWQAREALAIKMDVAAGRLIPDSSIVAVVKTPVHTRSELAGRRDFTGRASRTYLDTWWRAIEDGLASRDLPPLRLPSVGMPNYRNWANKFPAADARLNALKPVMAAIGESYGMPVENVLTPDLMRQLAWEPPAEVNVDTVTKKLASMGARNWQCEAVAEAFVAALSSAAVSAID